MAELSTGMLAPLLVTYRLALELVDYGFQTYLIYFNKPQEIVLNGGFYSNRNLFNIIRLKLYDHQNEDRLVVFRKFFELFAAAAVVPLFFSNSHLFILNSFSVWK